MSQNTASLYSHHLCTWTRWTAGKQKTEKQSWVTYYKYKKQIKNAKQKKLQIIIYQHIMGERKAHFAICVTTNTSRWKPPPFAPWSSLEAHSYLISVNLKTFTICKVKLQLDIILNVSVWNGHYLCRVLVSDSSLEIGLGHSLK